MRLASCKSGGHLAKEETMLRLSGQLGLLVLTLLCMTLDTALAQQRRTALVVGNAAYETGPLRNPVNDATDMAALL